MAVNKADLRKAALGNLTGERGSNRETSDEMAEVLFGELRRGENTRVTAQSISIFMIAPDATQPRRALPTEVRRAWDGDPQTLPSLLQQWLNHVPEYKPLVARVLDGQEGERPEHIPAQVGALVEIAELAASIRRDGLTNPITVVKKDDAHIIETGERRWLAFHLLHAHTDEEQWTRIPARVVDQFNRWRQAAENNARQDLNAIGKARQLAVLLMDLLPDVAEFLPIDSFEHEQQFYAQVADGEAFRTPRGKGELLLNAMGLKHADQLRQYRALLRLPRDLWEAADDGNWSIAQISAYRESNHGTLSQTQDVGKKDPPAPPTAREVFLNDLHSFDVKAIKMLVQLSSDPQTVREAEVMIDEHIDYLQNLKKRMRG